MYLFLQEHFKAGDVKPSPSVNSGDLVGQKKGGFFGTLTPPVLFPGILPLMSFLNFIFIILEVERGSGLAQATSTRDAPTQTLGTHLYTACTGPSQPLEGGGSSPLGDL